jgi:hypothetical protein
MLALVVAWALLEIFYLWVLHLGDKPGGLISLYVAVNEEHNRFPVEEKKR